MNKRKILIFVNIIIVAASLFIVYSFYMRLTEPDGKTLMNYALFIGFTLFTFLNIRKLLHLIKQSEE